MQIPLRRGDGTVRAYALVDAEDFGRLGGYRYSMSSNGYARRRAPGGTHWPPLHRDVMGLTKGDPWDVDHISGDRLDCRKANLRLCTRAENHQNRTASARAGSTSEHRGVSWDPRRGLWKAQAMLNYKNHFIGRFKTEQGAADAAAAWRAEHMPFSNN